MLFMPNKLVFLKGFTGVVSYYLQKYYYAMISCTLNCVRIETWNRYLFGLIFVVAS